MERDQMARTLEHDAVPLAGSRQNHKEIMDKKTSFY